MTKTAVIIGSGVGGLATACRLATLGFQVSVMEANEYPGGKLTEISNSGFRFDAGPSLFTMPQFLDQVFEAAGKNPRDYYRYHRLDYSGHDFFEDYTYLVAWEDVQKFCVEVVPKLVLLVQEIREFLHQAKP
ncbi:MAG: phytoene desaturase family protein, partial [Cyclobacteriaceae bacterium]